MTQGQFDYRPIEAESSGGGCGMITLLLLLVGLAAWAGFMSVKLVQDSAGDQDAPVAVFEYEDPRDAADSGLAERPPNRPVSVLDRSECGDIAVELLGTRFLRRSADPSEPASMLYSPAPGQRMQIYRLNLENLGAKSLVPIVFEFRLEDGSDDGIPAHMLCSMLGTGDNKLPDSLRPGDTARADVCFEVPADTVELPLTYHTIAAKIRNIEPCRVQSPAEAPGEAEAPGAAPQ